MSDPLALPGRRAGRRGRTAPGGASCSPSTTRSTSTATRWARCPRPSPGGSQDVITRQWGELRIRSWDESGWWTAPERIGDRIAPLVGAAPGQIVVGDSTSVNVFKALVAAVRCWRPRGRRGTRSWSTPTTFPTDGYIAESAARMTGCTAASRSTPAEVPGRARRATAAVLLNHVDYRTGRLHDLPGLTAAVHAAGALAVWDLCHSAGALPVGLDAHGVDLAVGCTYKYLNGGPGSPAYLYVARAPPGPLRLAAARLELARRPLRDAPGLRRRAGGMRGRVGTPDILSMLALEAALDVWDGVTVEAVRAKSLALTDFFLECVAAYVPAGPGELAHARRARERGSQVALRCADAGDGDGARSSSGAWSATSARPDVLRFGFTPLYVGFADAERAARVLGESDWPGVPREPSVRPEYARDARWTLRARSLRTVPQGPENRRAAGWLASAHASGMRPRLREVCSAMPDPPSTIR